MGDSTTAAAQEDLSARSDKDSAFSVADAGQHRSVCVFGIKTSDNRDLMEAQLGTLYGNTSSRGSIGFLRNHALSSSKPSLKSLESNILASNGSQNGSTTSMKKFRKKTSSLISFKVDEDNEPVVWPERPRPSFTQNRRRKMSVSYNSMFTKPKDMDESTGYDSIAEVFDETAEVEMEQQPEERKTKNPLKMWKLAKKKLGTVRLFRKNFYPWVQLAGHTDGFKQDVDPSHILKMASPLEKEALKQFSQDPALSKYVPQFKGIKLHNGKEYVQMSNLLNGYQEPFIMDCKLGCRTFLETDVSSKSKRKDLLDKLNKIDPSLATPEEQHTGVTKLRYMKLREQLSSTHKYSFRIEAIRCEGTQTRDLQTLSSEEDIASCIEQFLGGQDDIRQQFVQRLNEMESALSQSKLFSTKEVIGSSLLFVYDTTGKCNVWMIDFGKTVERNTHIHHDQPWVEKAGSFEDGYITGLRNLRRFVAESEQLAGHRSPSSALWDNEEETFA